ncbi:oligopeptide ABC transporter substrate-binding protein [Lacticaseibacillus brantae]|uniref:Oligopeptide ABC transporter solute-binding component n=1 Tax=Lacticaseibacillus brantae DSM 23927 TaxID=1423727 RepID=A0A0R2AZU3_9LACO|nr:oligopeptide ABC transporter substrate-binding protein [Lacticaseibacillus brantae]KRM72792.1 oligopeptide ABC transporter solute-binding component [Lacticaseibacillus brantae DSM 23927]
MKKKTLVGSLLLVSALTTLLVACGSGSKSSSSSNSSTSTLAQATTNKKATVKGATFKFGYQLVSPFKGVFANELSTEATDTDISQFGNEPLFKVNDSYQIVDGGAANLKLDDSAKTATITINPNVKWSDGKPLVAEDIVYAYKIIANPKSQSQRYTGALQNIVGLTEYHDGKSGDNISGITTPDGENGKTVVIKFKEMKPGMKFSGNGYFWENAEPYHYLKDVAFDKLISSDKVRKNPIFFGPYKISKMVSGQSIEWVPNTYYYGDKPQLGKITVEVISPNQAPTAAAQGKYDYLGIGPTSYAKIKDSKNVKVLGRDSLSYSYMTFNLGKYDAAKSTNVMDDKKLFADKNLRLAVAYAMNVAQVAEKIYPNTGSQSSTLIPAAFGKYHDKSVKAYAYDLSKAEKLLDDAGYKKGSDGYRTDKNGKKMTIRWLTTTGNSNTDAINQTYMQAFKKIGLHVVYATGKPVDFSVYQDKLTSGSNDYDMFDGSWSLSSEPSPSDLYSASAPFNFTHFVTAKNTELLNNIDSQKAFDTSYRIDQFNQWQQYMHDEAYVIPTLTTKTLVAVSPQVKNLSLAPSASWADVAMTK